MPIITNFEKKFNKSQKMSTSKKVGIVLLVVATIGYLGLFIKWIPFLHSFLLGTFGLFSYVLFLLMYMIGGALLKGAKYVYSKKYLMYLCVSLISVLSIFHIAFTFSMNLTTYGAYLISIYNGGISVGGLILGLIIFPLQKFLYPIGAIFLFLIILAINIYLIYDYLTRVRYIKKTDTDIFKKKIKTSYTGKEKNTTISFELNKQSEAKIGLDAEIEKEQLARQQALQKLGLDKNYRNERFVDNKQLNTFASDFLNSNNEEKHSKYEAMQQEALKAAQQDYYNNFGGGIKKKQSSNYEKNLEFLEATLNTNVVKKQLDSKENFNVINGNPSSDNRSREISVNDFINSNFGDSKSASDFINSKRESSKSNYSSDYQNVNSDLNASIENQQVDYPEDDIINSNIFDDSNKIEDTQDSFEEVKLNKEIEEKVDQIKTDNIENIDLKNFQLPKGLQINSGRSRRGLKHNADSQTSLFNLQDDIKQENSEKFHIYQRYVCPSIDLLTKVTTDSSSYNENSEENARAIERTLENFGISAKVTNITVGPAVTRYELDMPAGISVNMVNRYSNDISAAVASSRGVRIQAPIPGKSAVGVEVPNKKVAMVGIREILESKEFLVNKNVLSYAVGKEVTGKCVVSDMHEMPHMLVAGSTGSGKSVALNSIIISLIYKYGPEDLKFILVDPKQVEFYMYNGLPHLLMPEAIIDPVKSLNALDWSINEMERRYGLLRESGVREICEYNELPEVKNHSKEKLPHIVIIIDEVGDIMSLNNIKKDFEDKVRRLTQKARAVGINLILATQRPSVNVITGVIKANLPSRMAFAVQNYQDSKTILDTGGADKLLGKGDMLFSPRGIEPYRVQGCFISTQEINNVVSFVKQNNECYYDENISKVINKEEENFVENEIDSQDEGSGFDPLMSECLKLVIKNGCASASMLQRRFSIGNPKAARIIDQMEVAKFIGPSNGSKPRAVYITAEQYREIFGEGIDD